jgi:hypothetical protein
MITSVGKQTPRLQEIDFLKAVLIILIRSIQELKQELDEVTEAYSSRIASNATNILSSSTVRKSIPPSAYSLHGHRINVGAGPRGFYLQSGKKTANK